MKQLGYASPTLGFTTVYADGSVVTDGQPNPNAIVSEAEGQTRLDVDGNGIINANPVPSLGSIKVTREEGWQGNLGYRVVLEDWAEGQTPENIALAVYNLPDGNDYNYTTGAMQWDGNQWYAICPPGFEPGQVDIHMGFLHGSLPIAAFTFRAEHNEGIFEGGGDFPAPTPEAGMLIIPELRNTRVGAYTASSLPEIYSPEGYLIESFQARDNDKFVIKLEGGAHDAADPTLIIHLPEGNYGIGFIWNDTQNKYISAIETGMNERLDRYAEIGYALRVELQWV